MSTESRVADRSASSLERLYRKHSLATRILHWANFIVIAVLLWTAFLLLSGTPELPYSHWLSPGFYAALHLDNRNDEGRVWHVLFSFLMIAIGVFYVAYLAGSGRWKTFVPNAASWKDAYLVVLNDLGVRRHTPSHVKYNGAQRIAYTGVVLLGLGEVVTGLPIYLKNWTGFANLLGGQDAIRAEHFAFMLASSCSSSCTSCKSHARAGTTFGRWSPASRLSPGKAVATAAIAPPLSKLCRSRSCFPSRFRRRSPRRRCVRNRAAAH